MKRREFLDKCAFGFAVAAGSLASRKATHSAEDTVSSKIDADKLAETAHEHFIPGKRTCCESILMAGCEALEIQSELVPDIALGLAGGIGLQGDTCGVITSSAMVLSLAVAAKENDYLKKKMQTLGAVGRLVCAFKEKCGHTDCRSLCGLDLTRPEDRMKLKESVKSQTCAKLVEAGARLLAKELQSI
jgi:C_GCAxxG_C_C family probable redox protein